MKISSLQFRVVSDDEVPSWVLQPLPPDVQDAIDILEEALDELRRYLEQPFRLRYWRARHRISDAIVHLEQQPQPTDEEWLREMGIEP
jgi:hypothetical protein